MKVIKLLAIVLSFAIFIISLPTAVFAAEQKTYATLYNEKNCICPIFIRR